MATWIDIDRVEERIQHKFRDPELAALALTAPSKIHDKDTRDILYSDDGNRRLAQLGRRLLDFILSDILYRVGTNHGEDLLVGLTPRST